MRKIAVALALTVAVMMCAPLASAKGGSGWGKGLLSQCLVFQGDTAEGYMYWSQALDEFKFDFHGYYLVTGDLYNLVYSVVGQDDEVLGWGIACDIEGSWGVHIKDVTPWPNVSSAMMYLMTESGDPVLEAGPVNLVHIESST